MEKLLGITIVFSVITLGSWGLVMWAERYSRRWEDEGGDVELPFEYTYNSVFSQMMGAEVGGSDNDDYGCACCPFGIHRPYPVMVEVCSYCYGESPCTDPRCPGDVSEL